MDGKLLGRNGVCQREERVTNEQGAGALILK